MKRAVLSARDESGRLGLKALVTLAILVGLIYSAFQLVPIYWDHYNLRESAKEKASFALVRHPLQPRESLEREIFTLLESVGAQYEEEDIVVEVDQLNKEIFVSVRYSRHHELPFYQNPKEFYFEVQHSHNG
jgi:hypothetical protein